MVERLPDVEYIPRLKGRQPSCRMSTGPQHSVGDHHALGQSGRARRVADSDDVVGPYGAGWCIGMRMSAQRRQIDPMTGTVAPDHIPEAETWQEWIDVLGKPPVHNEH